MKIKLPTFNLIGKLLFYLVLTSIIPLMILGIISYNISKGIVINELEKSNAALVTEKNKLLSLLMEEVNNLVANICSVEDIENALINTKSTSKSNEYTKLATQAQIGYILSGYTNLNGLISIDIFSMAGDHYHVGDTLNINNINDNQIKQLYRETARSNRAVVWNGIEDNVNLNSPYKKVITASKIIRIMDINSISQKPIGFLIVNYDIDVFYDYFNPSSGANEQTYLIIDARNRIVYHPDKRKIAARVNPLFLKKLSGAAGSIIDQVNGQKTIIIYKRCPKSDWRLISFVPFKQFEAKINRIRNNMLIVLAVCFCLVAIISIYISQKMISPIRRITNLFREIKEGTTDLNFRLHEDSNDEIGDLIKWFNTFLESLVAKKQTEEDLKANQMQLQELNKTLESRIKEEVQKNRDKDLLLAKQSRQAAMGEMIGNIAHQWRQPLNSVGLIIQNISEAFQYQELTQEYLDSRIANATGLIHYMSQTIDDFRNFYKPDKDKQKFSLVAIIKKTISFVEASFKNNNIQINLVVDSDTKIVGYPNEYSQALLTILNNSKDAYLTNKRESQVVTISLFKEDEHSVVLIRDHAGGIPEDIIDKIFEPYFTTKEPGQGTGIGLYMSKNIIEKNMGGTLSVKNTDDGAEFRIEV